MQEHYTPQVEYNEDEKLLSTLENIFRELPPAYKRFATFADWILTLKGIKASTDFSFLGDTYDEAEFQKFKEIFEKNGLKFSEVKTKDMKDGTPRRQGLVYNPEALKQQTANSKLVPPYDGQMDIDVYINQATEQGYDPGAIAGKLYSFPESAIKDYVKKSKSNKVFALLEYFKLAKSSTISGRSETYWFYGEPKEDVIKRETEKEEFFKFLKSNTRFKTIMQSDDLKKSNEEWSRRLPAWTQKYKK